MGRPSFRPSEEQRRTVKLLAAFGNRQEEIASIVKVSDRTLRKHFREELDHGAIEANSQVAHALFRKAKDGDTTAQMFWLKCRAGWRERRGVESDAPAPFVVSPDRGSS